VDRNDVEAVLASGRPALLNGASLIQADLSGLDLSQADLSYATLTDARLDGAVLREARLWSVEARSASFVGADLRDADLTAADLRDADLTRALLTGARLTGTNLTGANLSDAELPPYGLAGALTVPASEPTPSPGPGPVPGAAGSAGSAGTLALEETASDSEVDLPVGGTLEIRLEEGATGYRWRLAYDSGPCLELVSSTLEPAGTDAAGALGGRTFRFSGRLPGRAEIRLELTQPWDPASEPERVFSLVVHVA
jgi:predicted secreted protein